MNRVTTIVGRAALAFLYVPIVAILVYSANNSEVSYRWAGFSLRWYGVLAKDAALLDALRVSLVVGVVASTATTVVGLLAALALGQRQLPGRTVLLGLVTVPLVVPEIVLGVALLTVFSSLGVSTGLTTIVLGHLVITLPLAVLVLLAGVSGLDPSLTDAAADLGCTPWGAFRKVTLPLLRPSLVAAWLLSFTTSFGNIVMSTFTNGVGSTTLPLRVYSLLKSGLTPEINALGAVLVLATFTVLFAVGVRQVRVAVVGPSARTGAAAASGGTGSTSGG